PFFADTPPAELDQMLALMYGNRIMASAFIGFDINIAGKFISKLYGEKWLALINFNSAPIDIGAKEVTKTVGSENTVGTKVDVSNSENKVSAFNSDVLITDSGSNNTLDENTTKGVNKDATVSVIDWQTAFNNLSTVERTNIISVVLKDVSTYLTVSVY
ncbi:MAG: hypothetical protein ACRC29_11990, partial [Enterobacterales bacterium]